MTVTDGKMSILSVTVTPASSKFISDNNVLLITKVVIKLFGFVIYTKLLSSNYHVDNKNNSLLESYVDWVRESYNKNKFLSTLDDHRLDLLYAAVGIQNEAAEISSSIMKDIRLGKKMSEVNNLEESGDIMFYLALWMAINGFTSEQVIFSNVEKLSKVWPDGKPAASRNKSEELLIVEKHLKNG